MALAVVVGLTAACTPAAGSGSNDRRPVVLTTFTVLADMAREVGGEHVDVRSITRPGAEIHDYEPTPSDVAGASKAALILDNGLGLERWFAKFVASARAPHVVVSTGVEPIDITADAYAGRPNPHAWMSPAAARTYVDNIVRALGDLLPDHAADFTAAGVSYQERLRGVEDELTRRIAALPRSARALVTCEGAFSYLARDAGLTEHYLWPVNAEHEGTPRQVATVVDTVTRERIPAVFCESTVSDQPMRQVAAATGARFGGTLYVDSLSPEGGPVPTYLDLLRHDVETIVTGLEGRA